MFEVFFQKGEDERRVLKDDKLTIFSQILCCVEDDSFSFLVREKSEGDAGDNGVGVRKTESLKMLRKYRHIAFDDC